MAAAGLGLNGDRGVLRIAVSKGRILEQAVPLLAAAGIAPAQDPAASRRLVLETTMPGVEIVIVRASDVPTYVEYGAAALGIAGRDVLLEGDYPGLCEPVDLGIARCRLAVAGPAGSRAMPRHPRVATKYVNITRRHFARSGRRAEVIRLYGSMELAPLVGLADLIVDLVDTGNTLRANGLEELETITQVSSRLVVNKAALKLEHRAVSDLVARLRRAAAAATGQAMAGAG